VSSTRAAEPVVIPITRLQPGLRAVAREVDAAVRRVLDSGVFIGGPEVLAFESELADYLGVRACVGVNSGTDALVLALRAFGVGAGDEVLVPAFGFIASAEAVSLVGGVPVFVDIEPRTFNIDPAALDVARSPRTRGIIAVHLFGQAAPMAELSEYASQHGLWVLEDAAQALGGSFAGVRVGSIGHAAAVSFFPSKNLGACGDAGLIATNDLLLAEAARALRQHGAHRRYEHERLGQNSRLDALQAAILRAKLPSLDACNAARRAAARRYDALLAGAPLELPFRDPRSEHTFHQYTVRLREEQRDLVQARLLEQGVESVVYYRTPLHHQPVYRKAGAAPVLPRAEAASRSVLSLPIWPEISSGDQESVSVALRAALTGR
jgi:dTDP-4-amino-4,6-dideoxygalactose transaminase